MTEILTESFCERCGTRYTFESSAPRTSRIARVRTLSKGVRNFVMSDESSFSEAMAEARSEEELAATAHQLDAFHQTFNFCLTCRQYTCGDCWNGPVGRCLTCAPLPGQESVEPALVALAEVAPTLEPVVDGNGHAEEVGVGDWPEIDLPADRLARVLEPEPEPAASDALEPPQVAQPDTAADAGMPTVIGIAPGQSLDEAIAAYESMLDDEETAAAEALDEAGASALPAVAAGLAVSAATEPDRDVSEPEPTAATPVTPPAAAAAIAALGAAGIVARDAVTPVEPSAGTPVVEAAITPLPVVPPDVAVPELEPAPVAAEPVAAEPVAAEPAPEVEPEPAPVAAAPARLVEPEPAPVTAEPAPVVEPEPAPVAAEPAPVVEAGPSSPPVDHVRQPTWPMPAPPAPPVPTTPPTPAPVQPTSPAPWLTIAPEDAPPPQWPTTPVFPVPAARRDAPTTLAGRPLLPPSDATALWAASAKEVLGATPVPFGAAPAPLPGSGPLPQAQPCVNCGLSLSANARFCRRCGSRQG